MTNYERIFRTAIAQLRNERRYREFADLERISGRFPYAHWHSPAGLRQVVVWCSNDYLGMGQHPAVIAAMTEAVENRRRRHAQHFRHAPSCDPARARASVASRKRKRAPVHLGLRREPDRACDRRASASRGRDFLRRRKSQLDHRRNPPFGRAQSDLPSEAAA